MHPGHIHVVVVTNVALNQTTLQEQVQFVLYSNNWNPRCVIILISFKEERNLRHSCQSVIYLKLFCFKSKHEHNHYNYYQNFRPSAEILLVF